MTLAEFKTEVRHWTERSGKPKIATHPSPDGSLGASLSESLRTLCAWAYCFKSSASASPSSGSTLDLSSLSPRILHPLSVKVATVELTDFRGAPGPVRAEDLIRAGIGSGAPTKWAFSGGGQVIQFDKALTGSTAVAVYGFAEHPTVSADNDVIQLPTEWLDAAAAYAAARLVQPAAAGAGQERLEFMTAAIKANAYRLAMEIQRQHPSISIPMLRGMAQE